MHGNRTNAPSFENGDCFGDVVSPVCLMIGLFCGLVVLLNIGTFISSILIIRKLNYRGCGRSGRMDGMIIHHKGAIYLIANLSFADLMTGFLLLVAYIWDYLLQGVYKKVEDFYTCKLHQAFVLSTFTASLLSVLAIAVDRFIYIRNGIRYNSTVTSFRLKVAIALIWALSLFHFPAIGMAWTYGSQSGRTYYRCNVVETSSDAYLFLYSTLFLIIPVLVTASLYTVVVIESIKAKRKLVERNRTILTKLNLLDEVNDAPMTLIWRRFFQVKHKKSTLSEVPSDSSIAGFYRKFVESTSFSSDRRTVSESSITTTSCRRISETSTASVDNVRSWNGSEQAKKPRRSFMDDLRAINEIKGVYALGLLVFVMVIFWFPYGVGMLLYLTLGKSNNTLNLDGQINTTFVMLGLINSMLNPLLYAFGYKEFRKNLPCRQQIKKFFSRKPKPKPSLNA